MSPSMTHPQATVACASAKRHVRGVRHEGRRSIYMPANRNAMLQKHMAALPKFRTRVKSGPHFNSHKNEQRCALSRIWSGLVIVGTGGKSPDQVRNRLLSKDKISLHLAGAEK